MLFNYILKLKLMSLKLKHLLTHYCNSGPSLDHAMLLHGCYAYVLQGVDSNLAGLQIGHILAYVSFEAMEQFHLCNLLHCMKNLSIIFNQQREVQISLVTMYAIFILKDSFKEGFTLVKEGFTLGKEGIHYIMKPLPLLLLGATTGDYLHFLALLFCILVFIFPKRLLTYMTTQMSCIIYMRLFLPMYGTKSSLATCTGLDTALEVVLLEVRPTHTLKH